MLWKKWSTRVGPIQSWSTWFNQSCSPSAIFITLFINLKRSCSLKWPKNAQNTENIHRKHPKCITWFKNIRLFSLRSWRKMNKSHLSSPTALAKGPPMPGQTDLLQSLHNNSIHTFDMSQLDHRGTLFFTPKPKAFSCCFGRCWGGHVIFLHQVTHGCTKSQQRGGEIGSANTIKQRLQRK